jgi:multidrug resistance efflux pump
VLAVLDSAEYKAEYQGALAAVEAARERMLEAREGSRPDEIRQAKAELEEFKTQLAQAERLVKRREELLAQKFITAQELEDAKSQRDALQNRVEKLTAASQLMIEGPRSERKRMVEAELRRSEAELSRAKWRLDNTVVYAPITGTILKKNAELGNLVNPIAFNGSFSLCDMADLSKLEVELSISERDIAKVFKHQKCRIRPEAFPERVYDGYVSRLMPIADRAKSAVPVRVRLTVPADEEGVYLKPEMGAGVVFYQEQVDPTVPAGEPRVSSQ